MIGIVAFLISLIIFLLFASIILYIIRALIALAPPPFTKFANVIYGICLLIALIVFLGWCGFLGPDYSLHHWR